MSAAGERAKSAVDAVLPCILYVCRSVQHSMACSQLLFDVGPLICKHVSAIGVCLPCCAPLAIFPLPVSVVAVGGEPALIGSDFVAAVFWCSRTGKTNCGHIRIYVLADAQSSNIYEF